MTSLSYEEYRAQHRFPALDGLRGISVLLVITCHLAPHPLWVTLNGELGVQIFFVLSGYLITTLALREEARFGRVAIRAFFVRRSFRIMPLYYLVLAAYFALLLGWGAWSEKRAFSLRNLAAYVLYCQELPFLDQPGRMIFAHSWSLGIEEKFYLFWPLFAFVLGAAVPRLRFGATAMVAASFAVAPKLAWVYFPTWIWLGHCLFNYHTILVGCLLAFVLHDQRWYQQARWLGSARGTCVSAACFVAVHISLLTFERLRYLYPIATAFLIASLVMRRSARLLGSSPLVLLGVLSYGMYLTHWLCIELAQRWVPMTAGPLSTALLIFMLAAAGSVGVAYGLHVAIERPLIAFGRTFAARLGGDARRVRFGRGSYAEPTAGLSRTERSSSAPWA